MLCSSNCLRDTLRLCMCCELVCREEVQPLSVQCDLYKESVAHCLILHTRAFCMLMHIRHCRSHIQPFIWH